MSIPNVIHGTFTIERTFRAPAAKVFAAWADAELKARWFVGPPDKWTLISRSLDLRVGGEERLHGKLVGGQETLFTARYYDIVPDARLVYVYDMHHGGAHLSVSLATLELRAVGRETQMKFTEQAAFVDGKDGLASREAGTRAHFDRLSTLLDDPREVVCARVFDAPCRRVFQAFSDPRQLAHWWGPAGFRNSFESFDLRPGGRWRFVMHGPDGTDYPNENTFLEVVPGTRVVLRHAQPTHDFTLTMSYVDLGERTLLTWCMRFDSAAEAAKVREFVSLANEQNFDRLAAHLGSRA